VPKRLCPCCSGELYSECCQPYHQHKMYPVTALALMRSRYCAYAKGLSDYIIETTHPQNPSYQTNRQEWLKNLKIFSQSTEFQRLEIVEFLNGPERAFVTFNAFLKQGGKDTSFSEKSCFVKANGRWFYLGGVVKNLY
jgi:SEC-C motif domain protein